MFDIPPQMQNKTPADLLQQSVESFRQRAEIYGDNYKQFGKAMLALFPNGPQIKSSNDVENWNRLGLLVQIVSKLTRYCENFHKGGHDDSLNDISVYAAMLRHIDQEINEVPF